MRRMACRRWMLGMAAVAGLSALGAVAFAGGGGIDAGFGTGGIVVTDEAAIGVRSQIRAVAHQSDGKIVAAGQALDAANAGSSWIVLRYTTDGHLDPTFAGGAGFVRLFPWGNNNTSIQAYAVAVTPTDQIYVGGWVMTDNLAFGLARLNADGSLDASFGSGGRVATRLRSGYFDTPYALALQPDGKVVLAGGSHSSKDGHVDMALARYLPTGALDPSFGSGGIVIFVPPGQPKSASYKNASILALALDGAQRITAMGPLGLEMKSYLVRFGADGKVDASFTGGRLKDTFSAFAGEYHASGLAMQSDGQVLAGWAQARRGFAGPLSRA